MSVYGRRLSLGRVGGASGPSIVVGANGDDEYTADATFASAVNGHYMSPPVAPGSGFYNWWGGTNTNQHWWQVKFSTAKTVTKVLFATYFEYGSSKWQATSVTLQGSNDGATWTDLLTLTGLTPSTTQEEHDVQNETAYEYYRFVCTSGGVPYTGLGKIQMYA